jgi:hypothetical protein
MVDAKAPRPQRVYILRAGRRDSNEWRIFLCDVVAFAVAVAVRPNACYTADVLQIRSPLRRMCAVCSSFLFALWIARGTMVSFMW